MPRLPSEPWAKSSTSSHRCRRLLGQMSNCSPWRGFGGSKALGFKGFGVWGVGFRVRWRAQGLELEVDVVLRA